LITAIKIQITEIKARSIDKAVYHGIDPLISVI